MRAGIKSILLILACAVLFGAGFRPRPLPAAAYAATGYSFAGALRAWKEALGPPLPEAVLLDVPVVYQWPEMPNGCEATALTMLLQYYGFAADKISVAYDYIPRSNFTYTWFSTYGPDPASAYAGDPALFGFYCLAPAVAEGANRYLAEQDSTLRAVDISGADGYVLRRSIAQGRPVVVWATIGFEPVVYSDYSWRLYSDSSVYHPYKNLHCLVVCGYDADYFYIRDPLYGALQIECGTFLLRYAEMERRAVVLSEAPPDASALYPGGARLS